MGRYYVELDCATGSGWYVADGQGHVYPNGYSEEVSRAALEAIGEARHPPANNRDACQRVADRLNAQPNVRPDRSRRGGWPPAA